MYQNGIEKYKIIIKIIGLEKDIREGVIIEKTK